MNTKQDWHVVYTKPNCEQKLAQRLNRMQIENYCPHQLVRTNNGLKVKTFRKPLFTSKLFVHCTTADLLLIRRLKEVSSILYWLDKPAVVSSEEVTAIRNAVANHSDIQIKTTAIVSGQPASFMRDNGLVFTLPSLGYSLVVPQNSEESCTGFDRAVKAKKQSLPSGRFHHLLCQVPRLLVMKVSRVPTSLLRKLEQQ